MKFRILNLYWLFREVPFPLSSASSGGLPEGRANGEADAKISERVASSLKMDGDGLKKKKEGGGVDIRGGEYILRVLPRDN